jgi:rare lipoprotein A
VSSPVIRSAPSPATASPPASAAVTAAELSGLASYYAEPYHGRRTASGEVFDTYDELTAAHRTLPFNTIVRVTNSHNGRDVEVRINDRGPFIDGRVIDLSLKAAREIDMVRAGVVPVKLVVMQAGSPSPRGTSRAAGPPPPPPAGVFTVQVAAFEAAEAAESLRRDLEQRYRDVSVETFAADRTFYRVRVGRAGDVTAAEKLAEQLRGEDFDPFVVRLN